MEPGRYKKKRKPLEYLIQSVGSCAYKLQVKHEDRSIPLRHYCKNVLLYEEVSVNTTFKERLHKPQQSRSVLTALAHVTLRDQLEWTQTQYSGGQAKCI